MRRSLWPLAAWLTLIAGLAVGLYLGRDFAATTPQSFERLTSRHGMMHSARFAPDGEIVIYSASWDGRPFELFSTRAGSTASRSLGISDVEIASISSTSEMALILNRRGDGLLVRGTLARARRSPPGRPREVLENVWDADWSPDGKNLAVARSVGDRSTLEYPAGKVLHELAGGLSWVRTSPKGDLIAFMERGNGPVNWTLSVLDLAGHKRTFSSWLSAWGMAWSRTGDEIWLSGTQTGMQASVYAVTPSGRQRLVTSAPGTLALADALT